MITSDRKARLMLSCAIDGGDPGVADLVQNLGAEGAWAKIIEGVLGEPVARRAAQVTADVFERLAEAAGARFVVPGDDEWPAGLDDLRHAESIQRRGGEPFGLWLRGPGHFAHLMERSVAIVGSRAATAYGNGVAADLAADLVEQGSDRGVWWCFRHRRRGASWGACRRRADRLCAGERRRRGLPARPCLDL